MPSVSAIGPGATPTTRTPCSPHSTAKCLVKASIREDVLHHITSKIFQLLHKPLQHDNMITLFNDITI